VSAPEGRSRRASEGAPDLAVAVDQLIQSYARRAETLFIAARLFVVFASFVNALVERYRAGTATAYFDVAVAQQLAFVCAYLVLGVLLLRGRRILPLLFVSVALDAAALFAFLLPGILWPSASHQGILRSLGIALVPLATVASACRFHVRLAIFGVVVQLTSAVALVSIDRWHNGVAASLGQLIAALILFAAAAILALVIAAMTRRMVYDAASLAERARRARETVRVYVSERVARDLDDPEEESSLDGQQRHIAVLFCDLRDFTRYAVDVDPKRLVAELNAYFDAMLPAIRAANGTVDKFMGDAIMAVFSREDGAGEPAAAALTAAHAMRLALAEHNRSRAAGGLSPLRHGIGVHAGFAVAGNVGTRDRLQYTVIGDVVNVASRIERATKEQGTWLLCSASAWHDARRSSPDLPAMRSLGEVELRGVTGAVELVAPV